MHASAIPFARCLASAGLCLVALSAQADGPDAPSLYTAIGAYGASVGYAHRINDHWQARAQLNSGGIQSNTTHANIDQVRYDVRSRTGAGLTALADYYPWLDSGWHLSGGLLYTHQLHADLTGTPDASGHYTINGHSYTMADVGTLTARLKFNPVQPYLGAGWSSAPIDQPGWRFMGDLGLMYAGKPKVELNATGASGNPGLQADLAHARSALARQEWTVGLQFGAGWSF